VAREEGLGGCGFLSEVEISFPSFLKQAVMQIYKEWAKQQQQ